MDKNKELNKRIYSWLSPKLVIKRTTKYGMGVFATDNIKKDEVLIVMGGYVCNTEQENDLGYLATNYNMDISEEWSFCPITKKDINLMPQHIVNHSCDPNCGFNGQCFMVAIKNIKKGDEIVYDYAFVMWSSDDSKHHFFMNCLCGAKNCRRVITENDWKIKKLQKKYSKYFQPFLIAKFGMT